jgi:PAS domain S-box-containing protein
MLQAILKSPVNAILAIDSAGRIHSVNPATERLFGYAAAEMLGQNVKMLMPEPDRSRHDEYLKRYLATGEKRIIGIGREVEGQRKDGTIFPIHLAVGEFEIEGEPYFSGIITDLSTHAGLQAEIDRQSLLFQTVFDNVPEALVIAGPGREIILLNPAAIRMFGYGAAEIAGMNLSTIFERPQDVDRLEDGLAESASSQISITLRRKNGTTFPGEGHAAAIVGPDGSRMAMVSLLRDMSEELKQKEALLRAKKLKAIGQLTGGIAHDFNNLLTIISGNLELLEGSKMNAQDLDLLRRASKAADSGARLTNRLLTFARRRELAPEIVNLNEQVRAMTELLRRTIGDTIELRTQLAPGLWLTQADVGEVEAAVLNLAINARDAMPEGGELNIRTDNAVLEEGEMGFEGALNAGSYVRISVSDNGVGMSKAIMGRVFEPFFTTKPPGRGTGLGLSTIYGFIKQSNGHITIYSEPGAGTTVNLYLPRCGDGRQMPGSDASARDAATSRGERVLVVEDNHDVRELTVKRLKRLGYDVVECTTGAEAQSALQAGLKVDIVFSDIMMPGGTTGIDLGLWVEQHLPGIPVVLTTGFAEETARGIPGAQKNWRILRKPYTQQHLAATISSVLANRAQG